MTFCFVVCAILYVCVCVCVCVCLCFISHYRKGMDVDEVTIDLSAEWLPVEKPKDSRDDEGVCVCVCVCVCVRLCV